MSDVGKQFPSEMETYTDRKSGRKITKLTKSGENYHFYFTENSFRGDDKEIIYHHSDVPFNDEGASINLFAMDLETGIRTQLTDFASHFKNIRYCGTGQSRDGMTIIFVADGDLYRLDRASGSFDRIYKTPEGFEISAMSLSHDGRYTAVVMYETPVFDRTFSNANYDGFTERFFAIKRSRIVMIDMKSLDAEILLHDTHWAGHIQFAPDTSEYLTFCHEGPWNRVQQRIWMLNTITKEVYPIYRQKGEDSVGHEFWTQDGLVFFDNRGPGHDGTITSDKTQATVVDADGKDDIPLVGFSDKEGNILRTLELPYYCNHYHSNRDNTLLVADAVNDLVLIDISTDTPSFEVLCEHNTSWLYQNTHCHPTWSWSGDKILFASDCDRVGCAQLYMIDMK
ncbi:MAG: hypothetical protein IJO61_00180 [Oscillospiraceae bacterium]|nr:hypothetical protein [Oscillospiraceae bacterium]